MIRLFQFLWSGCFHVWREEERRNLEDRGKIVGTAVICKCTKCGVPRRFDLTPWGF